MYSFRGWTFAWQYHGNHSTRVWGQKHVSHKCDPAVNPAQVTPGVLTARMLPVPDRRCEGARWNHNWERSYYEPRGESVLRLELCCDIRASSPMSEKALFFAGYVSVWKFNSKEKYQNQPGEIKKCLEGQRIVLNLLGTCLTRSTFSHGKCSCGTPGVECLRGAGGAGLAVPW